MLHNKDLRIASPLLLRTWMVLYWLFLPVLFLAQGAASTPLTWFLRSLCVFAFLSIKSGWNSQISCEMCRKTLNPPEPIYFVIKRLQSGIFMSNIRCKGLYITTMWFDGLSFNALSRTSMTSKLNQSLELTTGKVASIVRNCEASIQRSLGPTDSLERVSQHFLQKPANLRGLFDFRNNY